MRKLNLVVRLLKSKHDHGTTTIPAEVKEKTSLASEKEVWPEEITLDFMARRPHTYWRFSQSEPGKSKEDVYAKYSPGEVTYAEDAEKWLSFVDEEHIATCFMYGDVLTKLCFDLNNAEFAEISGCEVKITGNNTMGEYEATALLVEENYSLADISTIRLLFSMVIENRQLLNLFYFNGTDSLDARLSSYGFHESADLVRYLKTKFDANLHISPEDMLKLLDDYLEHRA